MGEQERRRARGADRGAVAHAVCVYGAAHETLVSTVGTLPNLCNAFSAKRLTNKQFIPNTLLHFPATFSDKNT